MSQLVNDDGSLKTYVVVDTRARTVLHACNYFQRASKGMEELRKGGAQDLMIHNITHPMCPDWIQSLVRDDGEYCEKRAEDLDARAASLRDKAAELISQADEHERRATEWRKLSEAASVPGGPGI